MKWISVSEKEPMEGRIIIAYRSSLDPYILCSEVAVYVNGKFINRYLTDMVEPLFWMPFPDPPRIDGKEPAKDGLRVGGVRLDISQNEDGSVCVLFS